MELASYPSHIPDTTRVSGSSRMGPRQCTGNRHDGSRCENNPIPGGVVCTLHGGKTFNVQHQARLRLLECVNPALALLLRAISEDCAPHPANPAWCISHGSTCPEWNVRVTAAKALLDRAGYGPHSKITIEAPPEDLSELDNTRLASELEALSYQLRARNSIDLDPGQYSPRMNEADNANIMPVEQPLSST